MNGIGRISAAGRKALIETQTCPRARNSMMRSVLRMVRRLVCTSVNLAFSAFMGVLCITAPVQILD